MADKNILIQRNNAGTIDNVYPQTQWGNVLNKPTTFTPTAHTHVATDISDSGNVGRNLLTTSSATASTLFFKKNPDHTITLETAANALTSLGAAASSHSHGNITSAGAIGSTSGLVVVTTTSGVLTTSTPADSQSASALGTGTALTTERDVYYGTPTINNSKSYTSSTTIYAPTAGGTSTQVLRSNGATSTPTWTDLSATTTIASLAQNTLSSSYSVTGYRFATVQLSKTAANTTTTVYTTRIDLTDTNQFSASTGTSRFHRMVWNDGTSTFADNLEIYAASATTLQFRHNSGVTFRYRITWEY